jgi:hypothetical protein
MRFASSALCWKLNRFLFVTEYRTTVKRVKRICKNWHFTFRPLVCIPLSSLGYNLYNCIQGNGLFYSSESSQLFLELGCSCSPCTGLFGGSMVWARERTIPTERPSDRRLSAKWLPTFADRGCHVVSVTDPSGRILGFLDRSHYFSIK